MIAAYILHQSRSWLLAHNDTPLTKTQLELLNQALQRLLQKEPLPYITGHQEFYGLKFLVNKHVLIPRPETEQLVEITLAWLKANPQSRRGVDLGTGSGCIAVSLCKQLPALSMTALDISQNALNIAAENAVFHKVSEQITFIRSDLLDQLDQPADFLCANLPYIPSGNLPELDVINYEPVLALDGGLDGFRLIAQTLEQCKKHRFAFMIFELDDTHALLAETAAKQLFPQAEIQIHKDLPGTDRFLTITMPQE